MRLISLADDFVRRERLKAEGIPKEILDSYENGIDFRDRRYSDVLSFLDLSYGPYHYGRVLSPSEIGCALSHKKAYEALFNENVECGLVLEDDIRFNAGFSWADIQHLIDCLPAKWKGEEASVLHLGCSANDLARYPEKYGRYRVFDRSKGGLWNAHAYVLSRAALKKLYCPSKVAWLADDWSAISNLGINIYLHEPCVFVQDRTQKSNLSRFKKHNRRPLPVGAMARLKYRFRRSALARY